VNDVGPGPERKAADPVTADARVPDARVAELRASDLRTDPKAPEARTRRPGTPASPQAAPSPLAPPPAATGAGGPGAAPGGTGGGQPARRHNRRRWVLAVVALASLALVAFAADWIHHRATHVQETDARIVADMTTIASRVSGWIAVLPIQEGDRIAADQILAVLDAREAELAVKQIAAEVEGFAAERARLAAEIKMIDRRTETRAENERSQIQALQAVLAARTAELALAREEFQRGEALVRSRVLSQRDWDRTRNALYQAQHGQARAAADIAAARAKMAEVETERMEITMLEREVDRLAHREAEANVRLERARVDLADRRILSPLQGVVDRLFVREGEYVSPGQRIALVHDPRDIRIEANVKETQIARLKPGQPVEVRVDAFPGKVFEGRVTRIGNAATSTFALLPTPNPSGNFTKVTQRLPVRIDLVDKDPALSPGMMVEIVVDVVDR